MGQLRPATGRRQPLRACASLAFAFALLAMILGCSPDWEIGLTQDGQVLAPVTGQALSGWGKTFLGRARDDGALRLERALWESGITSVERVSIDGDRYEWIEIHSDGWLLDDGRIRLVDDVRQVKSITVSTPPEYGHATASLSDLAPTVAGALGVRSPKMTDGRALGPISAQRVMLIFIDGLGYRRYQEIEGHRIAPFLDSLGVPFLTQAYYPTTPGVGTAAAITGTTPDRNGVRDRFTRSTDVETIFDVVTEAGKARIAVESAAPFDLRNAEVLSPIDRDGGGASDESVVADALTLIDERMPELLWVRFTGLDVASRTYGLGTDEEIAAMTQVDAYARALVMSVPVNTVVLICSPYGMHSTSQGHQEAPETDRAEGGSLLPTDMFVPLWVVQL